MSAPGPAGSTAPASDGEDGEEGGAALRWLVVAVLALDAVLLALTELAWIGLSAGTVPLPLAALVAAVTTPLLVLAADATRPGTRTPLAVFGVWLATVVVVGLWSPAGAGVIIPDWRAILLVGAGVLAGLLAVSRAGAR